MLFHFSPVTCWNSRLVRAHWYLAVICFPGLKGPVYEQNPLCPFPASTSAADPPSENIPDHCRPLSPDRDGLDSSSDDPSPGVPEAPTEGQPNGDFAKENAAFTEAGHEPSCTSAVSGNGQADGEQQYTSESWRFSLARPFSQFRAVDFNPLYRFVYISCYVKCITTTTEAVTQMVTQ